MAWNGAGVFNRLFSWTADKAAAINITASRMDSDTNDIVTQGLGNCITRDGQGQPTANLPMATFRHTGVANGVARTDYAAMGQLEDGTTNWAAAGGGNDALAATYIPALTALVDGQLCYVRAVGANTTTTPTFAPNGLTARTITKVGGAPLSVADINGSGHEIILRYNLANTRWELLNPAIPVVYSNDAGAVVGPSFDIFRDSASPAVSDFIGSVDFNGRDSGAAKQLYARVMVLITDPTAASEDANIFLQAVIGGTLTTVLQSNGSTMLSALPFNLSNVTNALALAGGTTGQRSGAPTAGDTRYNTSLNGLEYWNGTYWVVTGKAPTFQVLTSGSSATYTPTTGAVNIEVIEIGGGGGGGAVATNAGGTGGTTSFNSVTAVGGSGGGAGSVNQSGGNGGTGGTGTAAYRIPGSPGWHSPAQGQGGHGAPGLYGGGAGQSGFSSGPGIAAVVNTGAGGGGGGQATTNSGGGGGGGEIAVLPILPATTYTYTIGAAGTAGAAGTQAGGAGGSGVIIVKEFYG